MLFAEDVSVADGASAATAAGGTVLAVNGAIGEAAVRADAATFLSAVAADPALLGATSRLGRVTEPLRACTTAITAELDAVAAARRY